LRGQIDWLPIEQVAAVIGNLRQDMAAQKEQIYETLGLSDIMRGATQPDETATAQQIKAQFGTSRMQFKQYELATFVRDAQRIKAEIICKHYQPETIIERSNVMRTPDAKTAPQAVALLKEKGKEPYRLNIESDSMSTIDYAAERDAKTQFMQSVGQYISMVQPMVQQMPAAAPFLLQLMQWALSGFRVSKQIEGVIDQAITAASQPPPPPKPPEPTPDQMAKVKELESRAKLNEARAQETGAKAQAVQPKSMTEAQKNATQSEKNMSEAEAEKAWTEAQKMETFLKQQFPMGVPDFVKQPPGGIR
jgi:hypothetical protein